MTNYGDSGHRNAKQAMDPSSPPFSTRRKVMRFGLVSAAVGLLPAGCVGTSLLRQAFIALMKGVALEIVTAAVTTSIGTGDDSKVLEPDDDIWWNRSSECSFFTSEDVEPFMYVMLPDDRHTVLRQPVVEALRKTAEDLGKALNNRSTEGGLYLANLLLPNNLVSLPCPDRTRSGAWKQGYETKYGRVDLTYYPAFGNAEPFVHLRIQAPDHEWVRNPEVRIEKQPSVSGENAGNAESEKCG